MNDFEKETFEKKAEKVERSYEDKRRNREKDKERRKKKKDFNEKANRQRQKDFKRQRQKDHEDSYDYNDDIYLQYYFEEEL